MLNCYYSDDQSKLDRFQNLIKSKKSKLVIKDLKDFYFQNRINYSEKRKLINFAMLSIALQKAFELKKSRYFIKIDQVCSGLTLIALLFQNNKLAEHTGLIGKKGLVDPYQLALDSFSDFFKNLKHSNERVLTFAVSSRKFHKSALMKYAYRQTAFGRTNSFVDLFIEEFNMRPDTEEWCCLNEISLKYEEFVNFMYPGLTEQMRILDEIITLVVDNTSRIKIRGVQGELFE